ncbi:MAG: ASKHA domain-containing protein [Planctomycetota bacterium]|jgi:uncharacterized 2Fe-2S/4Fe-4S cluster protein (DUF4445 family)
MEHFNVKFEPDGKDISVHKGTTILEAASRAGIIINTPCGGKGICKKCQVQLLPDERSVCSCQHLIEKDIVVKIPSQARFFEHKILTEGIKTELTLEHDIYKQYLQITSDKRILGLAVDIGTTTVVVKLIDLNTGKTLAGRAKLNPQAKYGDNVISRISYADTEQKLNELHNLIIDCINRLAQSLCEDAGIKLKDIFEVCAVGNTTMNHIFLKLPIKQLGQAPYEPALLDAYDKNPAQISLITNKDGNIHTPPNIAGFVGSDTIAVALAVDIEASNENMLIIDIGTNGELLLARNNQIYAASCAAGPALEGAGISCGGRAAQGAIEAVFSNEDDIDFDVIGNVPPKSICGSGLIDAAAMLTELGIIDSTGRFIESKKLEHLNKLVSSRITLIDNQPVFILVENDQNKVFVSQNDIRQIQLAKAAIRTGIQLLQQKLGIKDNEIKQIYLAGAFGNYIKIESALRIGLLPDIPEQAFHFIGNAAASGAQMMLLSSEYRKKAQKLARKIEYVEIAYEKSFETLFAKYMAFKKG